MMFRLISSLKFGCDSKSVGLSTAGIMLLASYLFDHTARLPDSPQVEGGLPVKMRGSLDRHRGFCPAPQAPRFPAQHAVPPHDRSRDEQKHGGQPEERPHDPRAQPREITEVRPVKRAKDLIASAVVENRTPPLPDRPGALVRNGHDRR